MDITSRLRNAGMHKRRVLIIDPDKEMRNLANLTLRDSFYNGIKHEVIIVADSVEASYVFRCNYDSKKPFDVVITDSSIAGRADYQRLLTDMNQVEVPYIPLVSGIERHLHIMQYPQEYGFTDSVIKPYCALEVHEIIDKALARRS